MSKLLSTAALVALVFASSCSGCRGKKSASHSGFIDPGTATPPADPKPPADPNPAPAPGTPPAPAPGPTQDTGTTAPDIVPDAVPEINSDEGPVLKHLKFTTTTAA